MGQIVHERKINQSEYGMSSETKLNVQRWIVIVDGRQMELSCFYRYPIVPNFTRSTTITWINPIKLENLNYLY